MEGGRGSTPGGVRLDERFRLLASQLSDFVALVDGERRFLWVNHYGPGLGPESVLGVRMDAFLSPEARPVAAAAVERAFVSGEPDEYEARGYGDGVRERVYRTRVSRLSLGEGEHCVLLASRDITIEREAERALRENEARFRSFLDGMPDIVVEVDADHRVRYTNRVHSAASIEAVLGRRLPELAQTSVRANIRAQLDHVFATGAPVEWTTGNSYGETHYHVRAVRLAGEPPAALVIATDTTSAHRAAERLRASEERLERAIAAGNVAVWEFDARTGTGTAHGPLARTLGMSDTTDGRAEWLARVHPEDRERAEAAMSAHLRGETPLYEAEYRLHDASGAPRRVLNRARLVPLPDGGQVLAGTTVDVTEAREAEDRRRTLERQLERTQRLESVGILAGGVAHDFNNLLAIILATAHGPTGDAEARARFADIAQAAERAAHLTQQLLAFARRKEVTSVPLDVVALCRGVLSLAQRVIPPSVEVRLVEPNAPAWVLGDRGQLEQVLMNLCLNARDAMPHGGTLALTITCDASDVRLTVADTGEGIPEELVDRVFEPFFTTKAVGGGTGLGLAVAHGIVQQHHGEIRVQSRVGVGTELLVRLPRHTPRPVTAAPPAIPRAEGGGTILVAEDEPLLRKVAARILEEAGYRVVAVEDGAAAVAAFAESPRGFDLVLLDVMMPRLDGVAAARQIRTLRPGVPILFCSGYSASVVASDDPSVRERLLGKPYRTGDLLAAVHELLATARA